MPQTIHLHLPHLSHMSAVSVLPKKEAKPLPVDASLVQKASVALLKHLKGSGSERDLFDSQSAIFLEFRLTKMPGRALSAPKRMCVTLCFTYIFCMDPEEGVCSAILLLAALP